MTSEMQPTQGVENSAKIGMENVENEEPNSTDNDVQLEVPLTDVDFFKASI